MAFRTLAERLAEVLGQLHDIEDDAVDYPAVADKITEARGPLESARRAALQYETGELEGP